MTVHSGQNCGQFKQEETPRKIRSWGFLVEMRESRTLFRTSRTILLYLVHANLQGFLAV
jgi:hypothetical protein